MMTWSSFEMVRLSLCDSHPPLDPNPKVLSVGLSPLVRAAPGLQDLRGLFWLVAHSAAPH